MAQTMEFKTEVSKLLDIVIHSLYSNKDITHFILTRIYF